MGAVRMATSRIFFEWGWGWTSSSEHIVLLGKCLEISHLQWVQKSTPLNFTHILRLVRRVGSWILRTGGWYRFNGWIGCTFSRLIFVCHPARKKNDLPTYLSMVQIADHHKNGFWQWRVEHGKHMSSQSGLSILPHNEVVTNNIPVVGFIPSQQTNMYNKYISSHCWGR